jgi:hypothetical protein
LLFKIELQEDSSSIDPLGIPNHQISPEEEINPGSEGIEGEISSFFLNPLQSSRDPLVMVEEWSEGGEEMK